MNKKKVVNFRLSIDVLNLLDDLTNETGKTKTAIIEEALNLLAQNVRKKKTKLKLLEKQNQQLQQILQGFQLALQNKDKLLEEKEKRIQELKEKIEIMKQFQEQNKKQWWKFWWNN